jgi:hypothetical protein
LIFQYRIWKFPNILLEFLKAKYKLGLNLNKTTKEKYINVATEVGKNEMLKQNRNWILSRVRKIFCWNQISREFEDVCETREIKEIQNVSMCVFVCTRVCTLLLCIVSIWMCVYVFVSIWICVYICKIAVQYFMTSIMEKVN